MFEITDGEYFDIYVNRLRAKYRNLTNDYKSEPPINKLLKIMGSIVYKDMNGGKKVDATKENCIKLMERIDEIFPDKETLMERLITEYKAECQGD